MSSPVARQEIADMTSAWKSFWLGAIAAVGIAVIVGVVLNATNPSAGKEFSTINTRL